MEHSKLEWRVLQSHYCKERIISGMFLKSNYDPTGMENSEHTAPSRYNIGIHMNSQKPWQEAQNCPGSSHEPSQH